MAQLQSPLRLGGAYSWSLLSLDQRLPQLYKICRAQEDSEALASAFAEVLLQVIFEQVNIRRGDEAVYVDSVSQQPPDRDNKRRIDFQLQSWKYSDTDNRRGPLVPFILCHVEVKRHGAGKEEVITLGKQIISACKATRQRIVYSITFYGTALRV